MIRTRVFDLAPEFGYLSMAALSRALGLNPGVISRIRAGEYKVSARFISGSLRAFPGKSFDDLFWTEADTAEREFAEVARGS